MQPNLLTNAWSAAHLPSPRHQALLCCAGSSGECAFRESLQGQYTSDRHRSKGLCFYHITGTAGDTPFSRISMGRIGNALKGLAGELRIRVTSSSKRWQQGDFRDNVHLVEVELDMRHIIMITPDFFQGCRRLTHINLAPLWRITAIPPAFLNGCHALIGVDLAPLSSVARI